MSVTLKQNGEKERNEETLITLARYELNRFKIPRLVWSWNNLVSVYWFQQRILFVICRRTQYGRWRRVRISLTGDS